MPDTPARPPNGRGRQLAQGRDEDRQRRRLPRLLSVRSVADQTTLPVSTVYDAIYRGDIPAVRIGRSVRVDERDVIDFIAARKEPRQCDLPAPSPFKATTATRTPRLSRLTSRGR